MTISILDHPELLQIIFHPRQEHDAFYSPTAFSVLVEVEAGIFLGGRLHPAEETSAAILFFHGNGEIATDYDDLAPFYTELGLTFLVMDYRGYGKSNGMPTGSNLLTDAVKVFEATKAMFENYGLKPSKLYVMGRSLGSVSAIEIAVHAKNALNGLIIESGFADTFALMETLGLSINGVDEAVDGFGNGMKMKQIVMPTLIIHGQADSLIPPSEGEQLYRQSAAKDKQLVLIPRGGHNDLLMVGLRQYFEAIEKFVGSTTKTRKPKGVNYAKNSRFNGVTATI